MAVSRNTQPELPLEMSGYATERFVLADELVRLAQVQRAGAVEAEIFYTARLLEVLAIEALKALSVEATSAVFANLEMLMQLGVLPAATGQWAHGLRRSGNEVRHVQRMVSPRDAELAALFAERWLVWFFRDFVRGPRLHRMQTASVCLHPAASPVRGIMTQLETGQFDGHTLLGPGHAIILEAPALPAVAAEILIDREDFRGADGVLTAALGKFPDDLRLKQLKGLRFSREGKLNEARRVLEPLYERYGDEEETVGIAAGLFKRLWYANPADTDSLAHSHRAYIKGWKSSKRTNAYLGVNAATTALFLEKRDLMQDLALNVRDLLLKRAELLAAGPPEQHCSLGFWDLCSLGEALVLLGDLHAARRRYREAIEGHCSQGTRKVARGQLERILSALGRPERADDLLNA